MASVVIAAHQEESVIGQCLDALSRQERIEPLEIVVSANGCTDGTAAVAGRRGARVIERTEPGKTGALNAADAVAQSFPRIYLDADIVLPPEAIHRLTHALQETPEALVAVPARRIDTRGRPLLVRSYFAVNSRLPAFRDALFGRGTICVTRQGRERFETFPAVIADDLFLDSLFAPSERVVVPEIEVVIAAPHTTRDLLARLVRVRRGNADVRLAGAGGHLRSSDRWAWWHAVVRPNPTLAPAAVPYVAITLIASVLARRSHAMTWGRDKSTRRPEEAAA